MSEAFGILLNRFDMLEVSSLAMLHDSFPIIFNKLFIPIFVTNILEFGTSSFPPNYNLCYINYTLQFHKITQTILNLLSGICTLYTLV